MPIVENEESGKKRERDQQLAGKLEKMLQPLISAISKNDVGEIKSAIEKLTKAVSEKDSNSIVKVDSSGLESAIVRSMIEQSKMNREILDSLKTVIGNIKLNVTTESNDVKQLATVLLEKKEEPVIIKEEPKEEFFEMKIFRTQGSDGHNYITEVKGRKFTEK